MKFQGYISYWMVGKGDCEHCSPSDNRDHRGRGANPSREAHKKEQTQPKSCRPIVARLSAKYLNREGRGEGYRISKPVAKFCYFLPQFDRTIPPQIPVLIPILVCAKNLVSASPILLPSSLRTLIRLGFCHHAPPLDSPATSAWSHGP